MILVVHCHVIYVQSIQEACVPACNRDCPVLASVAQWPEIQSLVSRGQIVSTDLPLQTHGWTLTCSGLQLAKQLDLQEDIVRVIGRSLMSSFANIIPYPFRQS